LAYLLLAVTALRRGAGTSACAALRGLGTRRAELDVYNTHVDSGSNETPAVGDRVVVETARARPQ